MTLTDFTYEDWEEVMELIEVYQDEPIPYEVV